MTRTLCPPDPAAAAAVPAPNLVTMATKGYWHCRHCGRLTQPVQEIDPITQDERGICIFCASPGIHYVPPVLAD